MTEDKKVSKNLDKVLYLDKKERKDETFTTAFKHRLEEIKEVGKTGYTRELVISVPKDIIKTNKEATKFVKLAGEIKRDKEANIEVTMEPLQVKTANSPIILIDFVFKITEVSNITYVITNYLS